MSTTAQTLLLNATFDAMGVISWQRAMTLLCKGRVEILAEHEAELRSVTFTFRIPSVVRLFRYVNPRRSDAPIPFTRTNIYARDSYSCQYCGDAFADHDLTFDHVIPSAQGGTKGWSNIVTCCMPCNKKKGARTPQEAGMTLLRHPKRPTKTTVLLRVTLGMRTVPDSW